MKATIIVTSYNYERFVVECVKSLDAQTYQNVEIIFVDDGSSDNTIDLIKGLNIKHLKIVEKQNGGQLSAFNAAIPYITGEFVFFVDADDLYEPGYLEKAINFYKTNRDADFLFSGIEYFGNTNKAEFQGFNASHGFSLCRTYLLWHWVGAATSAISMRRNVLDKILPLDLESDWRVRADDCLVWGASLVGAKKYFFGDAKIKYRVHGDNNFFGKKFSDDYCFKRALGINRMFNTVLHKNNITVTSDLLLFEFRAFPEKNASALRDYLNMAFKLDVPFFHKLLTTLRIVQLFFLKNKDISF